MPFQRSRIRHSNATVHSLAVENRKEGTMTLDDFLKEEPRAEPLWKRKFSPVSDG